MSFLHSAVLTYKSLAVAARSELSPIITINIFRVSTYTAYGARSTQRKTVAVNLRKLRLILDISDSNAETLTEAVQCTDDQERSDHMDQVRLYSRRKLLVGEGTS